MAALAAAPPGAPAPAEAVSGVSLNGLTYAYPGCAPSVKGVDLDLPRGSRCLLIGANGAGGGTGIGAGASTAARGDARGRRRARAALLATPPFPTAATGHTARAAGGWAQRGRRPRGGRGTGKYTSHTGAPAIACPQPRQARQRCCSCWRASTWSAATSSPCSAAPPFTTWCGTVRSAAWQLGETLQKGGRAPPAAAPSLGGPSRATAPLPPATPARRPHPMCRRPQQLTCTGQLSYLGTSWRKDVAFAGYGVPLQVGGHFEGGPGQGAGCTTHQRPPALPGPARSPPETNRPAPLPRPPRATSLRAR
jgi:hypothetical protein